MNLAGFAPLDMAFGREPRYPDGCYDRVALSLVLTFGYSALKRGIECVVATPSAIARRPSVPKKGRSGS
ncbi:MAG: hypothetical protein OXI81_00800 [Paracoccaceae bacterium]|nr:hypothetical protein [Paracoccaceae bacterium]